MSSYTRITIYLKNKIPTHCIINNKVCQFEDIGHTGEHEDGIEYYAENGKWGVFYYTNDRNATWIQKFVGGYVESYIPTKKSLTIIDT
jgi:hypothetical protein